MNQVEFLRQVLPHAVESLVHDGGFASSKEQQGAWCRTGSLQQLCFLFVRQVVLDGTNGVDFAAVADANEGQAPRSSSLRFAEDISTRLNADVRQGIVTPRHGDDFHRSAGFDGATEDLEAHVLDDVGHRHQLHAVARVRTVGSVPLHGFMPGHAWEGTGKFNAFHRFPN